jgi:hypothetical protein
MEEQLRYNPNLLNTQGAPAPATAPTPVQIPMLSPQQTPTNTNDIVNQAVAAGIKQGQKENAIQQIDSEAANVANQVKQTSEFMGLPLQQAYDLGNLSNTRFAQREILKATQGFLEAQAAGDSEGMRAYNDRANAIRDWTNAKGIDMSAYGSDRTMAQKQAAYDMANQDRYAEMLNTKDSGTFYNERFDYYKGKGLSDEGAHRHAYNDAQEYRTKRLRTLNDEFFANALNPQTGAIGNYGVQLIGMMRDEDPDSITPIVTMMPGPMQDYVVRMSEYQKGNAFDRSLQAANNEFEHKRDLNRDNIIASLQKAAMDNETRRSIAAAQTGKASGGSPQGTLTKDKAKGEKFVLDFFDTMNDIQNHPDEFKDNPYDHRLEKAPKEIEKALNDGLIDSTMADTLRKLVAQTHNSLWGAEGVKENALKSEEEEKFK